MIDNDGFDTLKIVKDKADKRPIQEQITEQEQRMKDTFDSRVATHDKNYLIFYGFHIKRP